MDNSFVVDVMVFSGAKRHGWQDGSLQEQVAFAVSARHNVTHGATLAIIMPAWMKYTYHVRLERYVQFAERIFGVSVQGRTPEDIAKEGIEKFEAFLEELKIPTRLSDVGIKEDEIDSMAEDVARINFNAAGSLDSRPPVGIDGVKEVYRRAL